MESLLHFANAMLNPQPKTAECPRCSKEGKESILKYRGSSKCMQGTSDSPESIKKAMNWKINEKYKQLMKYLPPGILYSIEGTKDGGVYKHYTFIACDECIAPEHIPAFAYFPDGWEIKVFKTKHYGPYDEEINFDALK